MTVGSLIKKRLRELHMTQTQLSKKSTVSAATITQLVKDQYMPRFNTMCLIAKALGLSLDKIADVYMEERCDEET